MTDFAGIGRLCSVAHCQIKDWLPFDCAHCHSTFCLNHRSHFAHDCAAWAALHPELTAAAPSSTATASASSSSSATAAPQRSRINPYACTLAKCHKRELQRIVCRDCQMQFCIEHRFSTDHNCAGSPAAAQHRILQQHKDRAAAKANAAKALGLQSTATASATAAPSVSATAIATAATADPATAPAASLFHAPRAATTNLASRSKLLLVPEQRAQLSAEHNEHAEAIANQTAAASTSSAAASATDVKAAAAPASASSTAAVVATTATVVAAEPVPAPIPVATYIIPSLFGDDEMSSYAPALTLPRAAAAPAIVVPTAAAQAPSTSCAAESATAASVLGASVNTKAWVVVA